MRGAKALDGKRVRLLVDLKTKGGTEFKAGEVVTFRRSGVVRCALVADDGRRICGNLDRSDFVVADEEPAAKEGGGGALSGRSLHVAAAGR